MPRYAVVTLPDIGDPIGGFLIVAEAGTHVPFDIRRLFFLHSQPPGSRRGYHAHRKQHQFLIVVSGACTIIVDDGVKRDSVRLDRPTIALHVPPMLWLELEDFAPGTICAVLTSDIFDECDYIRERDEFEQLTR